MTDTPEPVAWIYTWPDGGVCDVKASRADPDILAAHGLTETPLYTCPTGNPYIDLDVGSITVPIGYVRKMVEAIEPFTLPTFEREDGTPHSTQEVWEMVYSDRVKEWFSHDDIDNARTALELGQSVITAFDQEAERG